MGGGQDRKDNNNSGEKKECAFVVSCHSNSTQSRSSLRPPAVLLPLSGPSNNQTNNKPRQQCDNKRLSPANSSTARTAPPAMTPVPSAAGCSTTPAALNQASLRWGMVPAPTRGTSTMFCGGVCVTAEEEATAMSGLVQLLCASPLTVTRSESMIEGCHPLLLHPPTPLLCAPLKHRLAPADSSPALRCWSLLLLMLCPDAVLQL